MHLQKSVRACVCVKAGPKLTWRGWFLTALPDSTVILIGFCVVVVVFLREHTLPPQRRVCRLLADDSIFKSSDRLVLPPRAGRAA